MKQSIRSKRLMILFLILLGISFYFYGKLNEQVSGAVRSKVSVQKSLEKEKKKLVSLTDGLSKSSMKEKELKSLKDLQLSFLYRLSELSEKYDVEVRNYSLKVRNLEDPFESYPDYPNIKQIPFSLAITSRDYEGGKEFIEKVRTEFPVRYDAITIRYPNIEIQGFLLGKN